jgi:hypothetical protein
MKRVTFSTGRVRPTLRLLIGAAALAVIACNNDVNFNPAAPTFNLPTDPTSSDLTPGSDRNLGIVGTLRAEQGSCFEATILYDGEELAGARAVCREASGCAKLELTAFAQSSTGHHTISFQVLRQSPRAVDYLAAGSVRVTRENVLLGGVTLPLGPSRARLSSGESVSFDVSFQN